MSIVSDSSADQDSLRLKRWAILVGVLVILSAGAMAYMAGLVGETIVKTRDSWRDMNEQSLLANAHLEKLLVEVGYGGFVHHWKNWILRRDDRDRKALEGARERIRHHIAEYRKIPGLTPEEVRSLRRLEAVFEQYFVEFQASLSPALMRLSAEALDQAVVVSDRPALEAFGQLIAAAQKRAERQNAATDASIADTLLYLNARYGLIVLVLLTGGLVIALIRYLTRMHRELSDARNYMDTLLQSSPVALVLVDKDGTLRRWNKQASELFQYDNAEMKTLSVEDLMPDAHRDNHPAKRHQFMNDPGLRVKTSQAREMVVKDSRGQEVPVKTYLSLVSLEDDPLVIAAMVKI